MSAKFAENVVRFRHHHYEEDLMLPDLQSHEDRRGIDIDQVGVSNVRYPLTLPLRAGGEFNTVANLSMTVSLPHYLKGTHMSRFMIALNERNHQFRPDTVHLVLEELLDLLEAEEAFVDMEFPIFLSRSAPVTREQGLIDFNCVFRSMSSTSGATDKNVGVRVNVTTLCPCSKEISSYGAHNQRSEITIDVRPAGDEFVWFEDLIDIAEKNASCELYPVLKRPDEKAVTERAYDNPRFVEDMVRDIGTDLLDLMREGRILWFYVASRNYESIHNHDAFARIERGVRGLLLSPSQGIEVAATI